jgi:hypothetical protein
MSNNQHSVVPPTLLKSINQVLSNIASNYSVLFCSDLTIVAIAQCLSIESLLWT